MDKTTRIANHFLSFSKKECRESSRLYELLSLQIAKEDELLNLCLMAKKGQPTPNLLFASVHYLLLAGKEHPLKAFYSSMVKTSRDPEDAFPYFIDFCRQHKEEIVHLLKTKSVQTNEVRRCAYLYPVFCYVYDLVKKPLSVIEIGTSAGLNLLWDQFRYSYGTPNRYGCQHSPIHLTSKVRGNTSPSFHTVSPPVVFKAGIDLNIIDLQKKEDYLWLESLIWPEHDERRRIMKDVAEMLKNQTVHLVEGDGVAILDTLVQQAPDNSAVCIFHTHVANQIPEESKQKLIAQIEMIGRTRDVFHIYNNMWDPKLHLDYYIDGQETKKIVGETDGHGRWFTWEL